MRNRISLALATLATLWLSGCSTTASISSLQNGAVVHVKNDAVERNVKSGKLDPKTATSTPRKESFSVSTFGKYEFKAEQPGLPPFYGMLPRRFMPGYLMLDILFFTPAMLFNLNGVYPYYEFDIEKRILKYKEKETDNWSAYTPTLDEVNRARIYFGEAPISSQEFYSVAPTPVSNVPSTKP